MEAGTVHGELLVVPERVIVAPAPACSARPRPGRSLQRAIPSTGSRSSASSRASATPRPCAAPSAASSWASSPTPASGSARASRWPGSAGALSRRTAPGIGVAIAGWGMAVPDRRVTNSDLAQRVETSDAWIVERTGINERRWVGEGETTASLAIEAGAAAIKHAGLSPSDIGCCIVATCTPEQPIPPTAAFVQDGLGLRCGAFDIDAACSGFVYGLVVGASMVGRRPASARCCSSAPRPSPASSTPTTARTGILFGDGAGAVVLARPRRARPAGLGPGLRRLGRPPPRHPRRREPPAHHRADRRRGRPLAQDGRPGGLPPGRAGHGRLRRGHPRQGRHRPPTTSPSSFPTRPTPASSTPPPAAWASRPSAPSSTSTATATPRPRRCRSPGRGGRRGPPARRRPRAAVRRSAPACPGPPP